MEFNPIGNNYDKYNNQIGAGFQKSEPSGTDAVRTQESGKTEKTECVTCANRRYVDGSNDPGVSFKSPTKLSPSQAASAVPAHEREHYSREASKAKDEGREVISNDIQIFTSVCPECKRVYVSGGVTRTATRKIKEAESFADNDYNNKIGPHFGNQVDKKA